MADIVLQVERPLNVVASELRCPVFGAAHEDSTWRSRYDLGRGWDLRAQFLVRDGVRPLSSPNFDRSMYPRPAAIGCGFNGWMQHTMA